ncbi:MAG: DUF3592 domain-containing protein [Flavobacteriaceae bacterium]|nr:DUF3592 domain-containing protein [Flavobacteriaceae bacterium]
MNFDNWNLDLVPTLLIAILLPLLLYASFYFFIIGVKGAIRMKQSKNWPTYLAKIISAQMVFMRTGEEASDYHFAIKKTYSYTVNNKVYQNDQFFAADSLYRTTFRPIEDLSSFYKNYINIPQYREKVKELENSIGQQVQVYVHPSKPYLSCLSSKFNKKIWIPILSGFLFGLTLFTVAWQILRVLI